ncbi:MAG TPA: class I SAM-dependent methyltransferase [Actinomycetota bacterium]|nr:class I SAM-dependent methyltransferase [Actinomycetota bacterium]
MTSSEMAGPEQQPEGVDVARLYRERFDEGELAFKRRAWEILCARVFQQYIDADDTVVDLGAGHGEFINAIHCGTKIAVDLNPDVRFHVRQAKVIVADSTDMRELQDASVDVVFSSNFFEHLPGKRAVIDTLHECRRILRPDGTLILLQPNIRYLAGRYWDFFDHHTPLTDRSMAEALRLTGFDPERIVPRFLPYTVKDSRFGRSVALLRLYLRMPVMWRLFGRQMLIVARPQR